MIEIYLKYDNMHIIGVINAFICINNHVNSCIKSILSVFKISRHQKPMISSSSVYQKYSYKVHLKELLKLINCLASSDIKRISEWLDLIFKALHHERKSIKERILIRLA